MTATGTLISAVFCAAALVTLYAFSKLLPTAKTYFNNDTVAAVVVVAGTFIGTLIVVSIITVRISDMILDSRIGALDRTLGFLFGLARGLLIVVVAFLFFSWLVPDKQREDHLLVPDAGDQLAAAGLDHRCEVPSGPAGNRGLVNVALA